MTNLWTAPNPWTDEKIEIIKTLWDQGYSAGMIAVQLRDQGFGHYSRNAITGKIHRLKLSKFVQLRSTKVRITKEVSEKRKHVKSEKIRPRPPVMPQPFPQITETTDTSRAVHFEQLNSCHCRWPLWPDSGAPFSQLFYCGAQCCGDAPYCQDHINKGTQPMRSRPR